MSCDMLDLFFFGTPHGGSNYHLTSTNLDFLFSVDDDDNSMYRHAVRKMITRSVVADFLVSLHGSSEFKYLNDPSKRLIAIRWDLVC